LSTEGKPLGKDLGKSFARNSRDFLCVRYEIRLVEQHPSKLVLHSLAGALIK
jgi:hypothetical protein